MDNIYDVMIHSLLPDSREVFYKTKIKITPNGKILVQRQDQETYTNFWDKPFKAERVIALKDTQGRYHEIDYIQLKDVTNAQAITWVYKE